MAPLLDLLERLLYSQRKWLSWNYLEFFVQIWRGFFWLYFSVFKALSGNLLQNSVILLVQEIVLRSRSLWWSLLQVSKNCNCWFPTLHWDNSQILFIWLYLLILLHQKMEKKDVHVYYCTNSQRRDRIFEKLWFLFFISPWLLSRVLWNFEISQLSGKLSGKLSFLEVIFSNCAVFVHRSCLINIYTVSQNVF